MSSESHVVAELVAGQQIAEVLHSYCRGSIGWISR